MPSSPRRICWDAWAFTELLNRSAPDHEYVRRLAEFADRTGPTIEIITSTLAMAEVAGLLRHPETMGVVGQLDVDAVERMWEISRVTRVDVTEVVARQARDIVRAAAAVRPRRRLIRGPDAVYLATAAVSGADTLVTRDAALLSHSGLLGIRICPPAVLYNDLSDTTSRGDRTR